MIIGLNGLDNPGKQDKLCLILPELIDFTFFTSFFEKHFCFCLFFSFKLEFQLIRHFLAKYTW